MRNCLKNSRVFVFNVNSMLRIIRFTVFQAFMISRKMVHIHALNKPS